MFLNRTLNGKKTKTKKNEVKNNPWERSCNSEIVHLIAINGWETHRELEYEKKKKRSCWTFFFAAPVG